MAFNENTRVKIPAILHLCRLGYQYLSLSKATWDESTNIFTDIFTETIGRINPSLETHDIKRLLEDISLVLDNEDLGKAFYQMLTGTSGTKLVDFNCLSNNSFHVVTELTYKNGEDEFRPDITILVNGMPLVFIEVKKPNNQEGVLAERDRINRRFKNKKFRKFINVSQFFVFSNNMEYDTESVEPIQGVFYASPSYADASFNCFRESEPLNDRALLDPESEDLENAVLKDNNLLSIKHSPEFLTNKDPHNPTNRVLTSLFSKERLKMLLKYSLAYVEEKQTLEKHIMRYPQFFATREMERSLEKGIKKGIIWHTQGSGKTALAYYNVHYLTDFFQKKGVVPKFYFIVDRIDLLQASRHLDLLNLKASLQSRTDTTNLLNVALEDVVFMFRKVSEAEMVIADQLKDTLRKTRETLASNFDQQDPEFVLLYDELKRLFEEKKLEELEQAEMSENIAALRQMYDKVAELNRRNNLLKAKYANDAKYARTHKRILERRVIVSKGQTHIHDALMDVKSQVDQRLLINTKLLNNEAYFARFVMQDVMKSFDKTRVKLDVETAKYINDCLVKEYMSEYLGRQ